MTRKQAAGLTPKKERIRVEYVSPDVLNPASYNPQQITDAEMAKLERSLSEFGVVDPIIARRKDGEVIGGHQRLEAAKRKGITEVPVVYLDNLNDEQAKLLNLALNRISGEWDMPRLGELLADLGELPDIDLSMSGFDVPEMNAAITEYRRAAGGLTDDDAVPDVPEEPVTKPGDLYVLGDHRLLCGDATKEADVSRLGAAQAGMCVTDPPYGVEYDPAWRDEAHKKGQLSYGVRRVGAVRNDDRSDWQGAWKLIGADVLYCWHASFTGFDIPGFEPRTELIWKKPAFVISRGHYHWGHEPCWYAVRKGATAKWIGDRRQSTVWEVGLDTNVEGGHSTQKPVECMERAIRNHDFAEVYDPFLGSGTTMIACEKLGRRCYGMEIEPRYVDVAVRRWEEYTGGTAKKA